MRFYPHPGIWILPCLLLLLLLVLGGPAAVAQSFPRLLEDIKVLAADGQEVIQFKFSQPYEGEPLQDFDRGSFSLNFSSTGSTSPVRNFRVNDSKLINNIKVVQNRFSTTVTFYLIDPNSSLQEKLVFRKDKNILRTRMGTAMPSLPPPGEGEASRELLAEMTDKIAGKGAALPPEENPAAEAAKAGEEAGGKSRGELAKFKGSNWFPAMITLAVSLAAIVLALYLVLFLYNRFFARKLGRLGGNKSIRQLASTHIGPKQRVVILEIYGEIIACGITPTQISYLTHLDGGGRGQRGSSKSPAPAKPPAAPRGKSGGKDQSAGATSGAEKPPATPGETDPVRQFADALKEKVGSMKRLK